MEAKEAVWGLGSIRGCMGAKGEPLRARGDCVGARWELLVAR